MMPFNLPDLSELRLSSSANQKQQAATVAKTVNAAAPCVSCSPENITKLEAALAKYYPGASSELLTALAVNLAIQNERPMYPSNLGTILTSVAAALNLTPINSEQKDCFLQPERFVMAANAQFLPRYYNQSPTIINFDNGGFIPVDDGGEPSTIDTATLPSILTEPGLMILGYLFIVKRADLLNGVCNLEVQTDVYHGSFELTDNNREARLAVMNAKQLHDLTVNEGTPLDAENVRTYSVQATATSNTNSYVLAPMGDKSSLFTLKGINCNVKAYPLVLTREKYLQVVKTIFSRNADKLVGTMLTYA